MSAISFPTFRGFVDKICLCISAIKKLLTSLKSEWKTNIPFRFPMPHKCRNRIYRVAKNKAKGPENEEQNCQSHFLKMQFPSLPENFQLIFCDKQRNSMLLYGTREDLMKNCKAENIMHHLLNKAWEKTSIFCTFLWMIVFWLS